MHAPKILLLCTIAMPLIAPPKNLPEPILKNSLDVLCYVAGLEIKRLQQENLLKPENNVALQAEFSKPLKFILKKVTFKNQVAIVRSKTRKQYSRLPYHSFLNQFDKNEVEEEHQRARSDLASVKCLLCDHRARTHPGLLEHILAHHEGKNRPFPCPYCGSGFTRRDRLDQHIFKKH